MYFDRRFPWIRESVARKARNMLTFLNDTLFEYSSSSLVWPPTTYSYFSNKLVHSTVQSDRNPNIQNNSFQSKKLNKNLYIVQIYHSPPLPLLPLSIQLSKWCNVLPNNLWTVWNNLETERNFYVGCLGLVDFWINGIVLSIQHVTYILINYYVRSAFQLSMILIVEYLSIILLFIYKIVLKFPQCRLPMFNFNSSI